MIDWTSDRWGMAGHNVHEASNGSWVQTEEGCDQ